VSGLWWLQADLCRALPQRLQDVLADERALGVVLVVEVGREFAARHARHAHPVPGASRCALRVAALQALRRGEFGSVTLIANDTRITLRRRSHLRLWRRPRPGLRSFA